MSCENVCSSTSAHSGVVEIPSDNLTRRALLSGLAATLAGIGLLGPAETAMAAAKTYTVGKTGDIRVGGAKKYQVAGQPVIITQPKKGTFKAFNGYCTHERVEIGSVSGSNLVCPEHGATFNTTTGKNTGGPARTGLKGYKVTLAGTTIKVTI